MDSFVGHGVVSGSCCKLCNTTSLDMGIDLYCICFGKCWTSIRSGGISMNDPHDDEYINGEVDGGGDSDHEPQDEVIDGNVDDLLTQQVKVG